MRFLDLIQEYHKYDHFRFDTVDITRAALTQIFDFSAEDIMSSCNANGTLPQSCGIFRRSGSMNSFSIFLQLLIKQNPVLDQIV